MNNLSQSTESESWSIRENGRILYEFFTFTSISIVTNFFIIFLCFRSSELKSVNHSKYFIVHTAFLDLAYSAARVFFGLMYSISYSFDIEVTAKGCTFYIISIFFLTVSSPLSSACTTYCRYRQVKSEKSCSKRTILILFLYPYVPLVPIVLNHWVFADSQGEHAGFCKIYFNSTFSRLSSLMITFIVSLSLFFQLTLSLKLYRYLDNHFKSISANVQSNRNELERLMTEKSILKAVLIQGLAPVILSIPTIIRILVSVFFQVSRFETLFYIGNYPITFEMCSRFVFTLNPLVDSWAVLFIHIPYSKARRTFVQNLLQFNRGTAVQEIPLSQFRILTFSKLVHNSLFL